MPRVDTFGPFYQHGLTLIPASHEIIYPFLNFNGSTVEV